LGQPIHQNADHGIFDLLSSQSPALSRSCLGDQRAIRSDRASIEFRSLPPSAVGELVGALGDKIAVQQSDWNCALIVTPNQ